MTPLVKSSGRPKWQRLPKSQVFYYKSQIHQNHYVLSFSFAFDKEDEVYQFALAPPYSFSKLQSFLAVLESKIPDKRFERTQLATTIVSLFSSFNYLITATLLFQNSNQNLTRV